MVVKITSDLVDTVNIEEHAATLDAHTKNIVEVLKTGVYLPSPLFTAYEGIDLALVTDRLYAIPYPIVKQRTADAIGLYVMAEVALSHIAVGIYADTGSCYPGALVVDGGALDSSSQGNKAAVIDETLTKGLYWLAFISDDTPTIRATLFYISIIGGNTVYQFDGHYYKADSYGALPANYPAAATPYKYMYEIALKFS